MLAQAAALILCYGLGKRILAREAVPTLTKEKPDPSMLECGPSAQIKPMGVQLRDDVARRGQGLTPGYRAEA